MIEDSKFNKSVGYSGFL